MVIFCMKTYKLFNRSSFKLTAVKSGMLKHPQEIEAVYIIPAIRKCLTLELLNEHALSQKEIAKLMGISEAAVSQYKKDKRGKLAELPEHVISELKISAKKINSQEASVFAETQRLLREIRNDLTICKIHQILDENVPEDCGVCVEHL